VYHDGQNDSFVDNSYDPSLIPTNGMPDNLINMLDMSLLFYRDSFYWGPRQAAGLPTDFTNLSVADYKKARMRHWRHDSVYSLSYMGPFLSIQQDFSPDGASIG